jgi:excisionase family DNA binding protein
MGEVSCSVQTVPEDRGCEEIVEVDKERLVSLLEAVRSLRRAVFQVEQELLDALTAEQLRHGAPDSKGGNTPVEWFTLAELGTWLKVSRTTAYRLIRDGYVPVYRIGRITRIRRHDIERWLEEEGRSH